MAETTDAKDDANFGEYTRFLAEQMARDGLLMGYFFESQKKWSYETFGPREYRGPKGPLDHLRKEAKEAYDEADPEKQKEEIADCLFLVFDAAHRAGMDLGELATTAFLKLLKNKNRTWPAWDQTPPDKATEHDRSKD